MRSITGCLFLIFFIYNVSCYDREVPSPPLIVKQPPTDEVLFQVEENGDNDKPFYIECEAEGEPAPKYRWIKNGKPFEWQTYDDRISQQTGRGTLSITHPNEVDIGQYQCFAENQYGTATSNSVFMRKAELNSFKNAQPTPVSGNEGEPFNLTCEPPDGWPKPKVHWIYLYTNGAFKTINSSRMTLDPEGNLWFSNLTKSDTTTDFMYACAATSPTKFEYKYGNRILLNVVSTGASASQYKHEPVMQYVTRKNEVAFRGKRAELFCIFGGTPLPQTVWSKNGQVLQSSERITQGNYGKSLILKAVDFEDEGQYTCEVTNGVGDSKSYSIHLQVLAVPYFKVEPQVVNAAEDETAEFNCEAAGVPEPEIKWIFNGKPISEAPPNPRRKVYKNKIVIDRLIKNDTGNYGCNATNSIGYVYKDVYVNVIALAPEISDFTKEYNAVDDQTITIKCKHFGAPKPNIKWIHNNRELTGGRFKVMESGDLNITNIQFDDKGNYTCIAQNKLGSANQTAVLDVKAHTYISDTPENYEVESGTSATFRCNAVADESLELDIQWLKNGQPIDFEDEPRFVKSSDFSLTITKTIELDSGTYTCKAKTELDEVSASAQLTVQDIPNPPGDIAVECRAKEAKIHWTPKGDNRAPILYYIIQYNTSFTPDSWEKAVDHNVPASETTYTVSMSPWANYTFRVIAVNKIGSSLPSSHSEVCSTNPDVPYKNPDNVVGEGDKPDNLVISWTPMPQIKHNGPGFRYYVSYKRENTGQQYTTHEITDWKVGRYVVEGQPSFKQYSIKVEAKNDLGVANVAAQEVIGFSGESPPTQAPKNFTVLDVQDATHALLSWDPVPIESINGHFEGYKLRTWSDESQIPNEIQIQGTSTRALVNTLVPNTKNYAQVYVWNRKYNGPPSEILSFDTPEGVPGEMDYLEAVPLGSSAFLLKWEKPDRPNGNLTGYNIYFAEVQSIENNIKVGSPIPRAPQITDPNLTRAKLAGLKPGTKYRIYISATTKAGESKRFFIERETRPRGVHKPSKPKFWWQLNKNYDKPSVKVTWLPNEDGKSGSHFYVKYKKKGEPQYLHTLPQKVNDTEEVFGLEPGETYDFVVVSVDGDYETDSEPQEVYTNDGVTVTKQPVATAGWFIGMMLAIVFLLLVLIIVCIIKRNRGGKYAVHEREQANGRHDYPEEGGFHEYSQPLDNKSHGRASMSSEKVGPESDTDSMAEYGDGDTEGMNEDGSFIGQYGRKKGQGETTSQGFATLV